MEGNCWRTTRRPPIQQAEQAVAGLNALDSHGGCRSRRPQFLLHAGVIAETGLRGRGSQAERQQSCCILSARRPRPASHGFTHHSRCFRRGRRRQEHDGAARHCFPCSCRCHSKSQSTTLADGRKPVTDVSRTSGSYSVSLGVKLLRPWPQSRRNFWVVSQFAIPSDLNRQVRCRDRYQKLFTTTD